MGLGPKTPTTPAAPSAVPESPPATGQTPAPAQPSSLTADPFWPLGTPLSMLLYTSTSPSGDDLDLRNPIVTWDGLEYGRWSDVREADLLLDVPQSVRSQNGSWFLDILLVKGGGAELDGKGPGQVAMYRKRASRSN